MTAGLAKSAKVGVISPEIYSHVNNYFQIGLMKQKGFSQLHSHVSGDDHQSILANVIGQAVRFGWNIIDIKQFVFNGF